MQTGLSDRSIRYLQQARIGALLLAGFCLHEALVYAYFGVEQVWLAAGAAPAGRMIGYSLYTLWMASLALLVLRHIALLQRVLDLQCGVEELFCDQLRLARWIVPTVAVAFAAVIAVGLTRAN